MDTVLTYLFSRGFESYVIEGAMYSNNYPIAAKFADAPKHIWIIDSPMKLAGTCVWLGASSAGYLAHFDRIDQLGGF